MVTSLLYWAVEMVGVISVTMSISGFTNVEGVYPFMGQMYSGEYTRQGVCACGWSYPMGTWFIVDDKSYVCLDRGRAITDNHLDIWFREVEEANKHGRKESPVLVVIPYGQPRGAFNDKASQD